MGRLDFWTKRILVFMLAMTFANFVSYAIGSITFWTFDPSQFYMAFRFAATALSAFFALGVCLDYKY